METRTKAFRALLQGSELAFIMEAHNAVSARIVEETGFSGIWASGLTISTSLGVRDSNEASWTQVLETLEFMAEATTIPIMLDGDTGYGNFNNFRRLVRKLEQRGIAAVCIEDKLFPKTNSFLGEAQPLVDIDEFCGKIRAGKDMQSDDDFTIVARVEALIAGWGMAEALRRAEAYRSAGADAILIHSKQSKPDEILLFATEWAKRCPLIIVPTMYYTTPTRRFAEAGIDMIIWANHNMRAAVTAMRTVSQRIFEDQSLIGVEGEIASVKDLFALSRNDELERAEETYLTKRAAISRAIVLAATRGSGLDELTMDRPKAMIKIAGRPLVERLIDTLNAAGVQRVSIVRGYKPEAFDGRAPTLYDNPDWESTGEAASLYCARTELSGNCLVCFGDILMRKYILDIVLAADGDIVLVVDSSLKEISHGADLVRCDPLPRDQWLEREEVEVREADVTADKATGRWIGIMKLSPEGSTLLSAELDLMAKNGTLATAELLAIVNRLIKRGIKVHAVHVSGHWLDVNRMTDLIDANTLIGPGQ